MSRFSSSSFSWIYFKWSFLFTNIKHFWKILYFLGSHEHWHFEKVYSDAHEVHHIIKHYYDSARVGNSLFCSSLFRSISLSLKNNRDSWLVTLLKSDSLTKSDMSDSLVFWEWITILLFHSQNTSDFLKSDGSDSLLENLTKQRKNLTRKNQFVLGTPPPPYPI